MCNYEVKRIDFILDKDYLKKAESFFNGKITEIEDYNADKEFTVPLSIKGLNGSDNYKVRLYISQDKFSVSPTLVLMFLVECNGYVEDVCYSIDDFFKLKKTLLFPLSNSYEILISIERV